MKVVLNFHLGTDVRLPVPASVLETLRGRFPGVHFVGADDRETLARELIDADVFYGWHCPPELLSQAPRLRWIQAASAGVERNLSADILARDIALTNAAGVAASTIAEHTLGVMLALCRNLHVATRLQGEGRWDRLAVMAGIGTPIREFRGSRVAVLGLGPIGTAVAESAAALGAAVRGLRRAPTAVSPPRLFEAVVGPDGLGPLLAWGDFVVVALPHTPETAGLIGIGELTRMGPEAYLVNVARGPIVDEVALVDALRQGLIAGAALDVFDQEPLPASSPLWSLPNVIVTPHVAGARPRYLERALDLFMDNLERHLARKPLLNLVDPRLGYPAKH